MTSDASASERALRDRIGEGGFAVALSGGGHRATLATLGALLAIIDRGLGPKIMQVAGVSGGSITNAFVAQRCRLDELSPGGLDSIATELATTIIRKGALTKSWIALLLLIPMILGFVAGTVVLRVLHGPWTWLAVAIGVIVGLYALLARGLAVEWLLDRRYFRPFGSDKSLKRGRARLASLSGRQVDHVFCMTDLVLGLPVYASAQHGGILWRRLSPASNIYDGTRFQTFDAAWLSIAEVVRASAAFPGIPPLRLPIPPDPGNKLVAQSPMVAYLADGGLWNNLGSQVLREDAFIGSHATWEDGVLRPYSTPPYMPLVLFNGSAPLRPARASAFDWPVLGLLNALSQVLEILNANTVLPRVDAMRRGFQRRTWWTYKRADHHDPADLIVDLRPTKDVMRDYLPGTVSEEFIRQSDPSVKKWETERLSSVRHARDLVSKSPETWLAPKYADRSPEKVLLDYVLGDAPEPKGSFPVCGVANVDDWDALWNDPAWNHLVAEEGTDCLLVSTTLDRIHHKVARQLIARAYINTYLVTLFLAPLDADKELLRLAELPKRLDKIVGR